MRISLNIYVHLNSGGSRGRGGGVQGVWTRRGSRIYGKGGRTASALLGPGSASSLIRGKGGGGAKPC